MRRAGIVLALFLAAACKQSGPNEVPTRTASTKPGEVTVHFKNATSADILMDNTYGPRLSIADAKGQELSRGEFCRPSCEVCQCVQCGSPLRTVARIPAGGSYEARWEGDFFTAGTCGSGCSCENQRFADDGRYTLTLRGKRGGKTFAATAGPEPNVFTGTVDEASAGCAAVATVTLGAAAAKAEATFSCEE